MSKCNQCNKARMRELAIVRALRAEPHARSKVQHVSTLLIERGAKLENKRVGWTRKDGTKGGCTMFVRPCHVQVFSTVR